jgi:hypothetical protein
MELHPGHDKAGRCASGRRLACRSRSAEHGGNGGPFDSSDSPQDTLPATEQRTQVARIEGTKKQALGHHCVYVVYLRNPRRDGKAGYYVGMTGLTPEERFLNHKNGIKSASVVRRFGERLVPKLYAHLNPMSYQEAAAMEKRLADELRARGFQVFGGH